MPIFDGLKNGQPRYFMYQPAQGINPNILAYASRASAGRKPASTGSSSTKKTENEMPDGLRAGLLEKFGESIVHFLYIRDLMRF